MELEHHDVFDTLAIAGPWYLLIRVHDAVWNDKGWPLAVRMAVCKFLWWAANPRPERETVKNA